MTSRLQRELISRERMTFRLRPGTLTRDGAAEDEGMHVFVVARLVGTDFERPILVQLVGGDGERQWWVREEDLVGA